MDKTSGPRCRRKARARAAIFWGLIAAAVLQLGLAVAIACWLPQLRNPEAGTKTLRLAGRFSGRAAPKLTVVMLGSSRTAWGFQSDLMENDLAREIGAPAVVFNFGITGAGPVTELVMLRNLLARGIRPDLVAIEVLPPMLAGQFHVALEGHCLSPETLGLSDLATVAHYHSALPVLCQGWLEAYLLPWYTYRLNLLGQAAPGWLPGDLRTDWVRRLDASGWASLFAKQSHPVPNRKAVERARKEYGATLGGFHLGGPGCRALRDMLALCRDERLPVALVLMPEGKIFQSFYTPAAWAQVSGFLDRLGREFAVPLINARDWVADDDFYDTHHLLPHGAEVFTRRFGVEVRRLLKRSEESRWSVGGGPPAGPMGAGHDH